MILTVPSRLMIQESIDLIHDFSFPFVPWSNILVKSIVILIIKKVVHVFILKPIKKNYLILFVGILKIFFILSRRLKGCCLLPTYVLRVMSPFFD